MKRLAFGLAGVLMVGASAWAEEPRRAFVLEVADGQLRVRPEGTKAAANAVTIHIPPQGVAIEAGPENTVIIHVDSANGDSSMISAFRARLILPGNPGQADPAKAVTKPIRTAFAYQLVDPSPRPTAVTRVQGSAGGGQQIEQRLTEVERKLELILKLLRDLELEGK